MPEASTAFEAALRDLGVTRETLTAEEKRRLDFDGFVPLHDIVTPATAARMRDECDRLFALEKTAQPGGPSECGQMQNKSDAFDLCVTHPRVLAAIWHVFGYREFVSMGVHTRPNPPGRGTQPLHVDYPGPPVGQGDFFNCNSIWPLTDFTVENGATRVIPGSHRWTHHPENLEESLKPHPQEIRLLAPLGTVVIFNSHVWHSAMPNHSKAPRPNVTSYFATRINHAGKRVENALSDPAWKRLPKACRAFFDAPGGKQWSAG